jgi:hypothetical protein
VRKELVVTPDAGMLLGPFALLFAALSDTGLTCPYCRSTIHPDAVKCPKCQTDLISMENEQNEIRSARPHRSYRKSRGSY